MMGLALWLRRPVSSRLDREFEVEAFGPLKVGNHVHAFPEQFPQK